MATILALSAALLQGCGGSSSVPVPPTRHDVGAAELSAMMGDGQPLVIADVRTAEAFADAHIPGSLNVPSANLADWGRVQAKDARICCVGDTGADSALAADALVGQGHTRVHSLLGGMDTWDGPVEPPPSRHDITAAQLETMMADGRPLLIVDVGNPFAFNLKHIPGSVNFPLEELGPRAQNLPRYQRICVGCT